MPKKKTPKLGPEAPDWFIKAWMGALDLDQVDLIRETGIPKATMSNIVNGETDYYRWLVNEIARAMRIQPFELLMHPDDAFALRRLRADALRIAADDRQIWHEQPDEQPEWGTPPARAAKL
jgi:hypothetical protein